jgi:hypothetical protein
MMRIPRVRLTVGGLLLCVAVVAANCWAYRYFGAASESLSQGHRWYLIVNRCVGVLPLANVALIGTLLFAASRLRFVSCEWRASFPSLAHITFFSVHLLLVGYTAELLMPDALSSFWATAENARDLVAKIWWTHLETISLPLYGPEPMQSTIPQ